MVEFNVRAIIEYHRVGVVAYEAIGHHAGDRVFQIVVVIEVNVQKAQGLPRFRIIPPSAGVCGNYARAG